MQRCDRCLATRRSASRTAAAIPSLPTSCWKALTSGRTAATPTRPWTPIGRTRTSEHSAVAPRSQARSRWRTGPWPCPTGPTARTPRRRAAAGSRAAASRSVPPVPTTSAPSSSSASTMNGGRWNISSNASAGRPGIRKRIRRPSIPAVVEADSPGGLPQPLGGGGALAPVGDPHRGLGEPVIELGLHWDRAVAQRTHIVLIDALDHTARSSKTPSTPIRFPAAARARRRDPNEPVPSVGPHKVVRAQHDLRGLRCTRGFVQRAGSKRRTVPHASGAAPRT